jgi:hypothetical protein
MPPVSLSYVQTDMLPALGSFLRITVFVVLSGLVGSLCKRWRDHSYPYMLDHSDTLWLQRPPPGEIW